MHVRSIAMAGAAAGAAVLAGAWLPRAGAQDGTLGPAEIQEKAHEGKRLANDGKRDAARACWAEVLKADPKHFQAAYWTAESHLNDSNPNAAMPFFAQASDIDPTHFMAAFHAGMSFRRYQQPDKALAYLTRANTAFEKANGLPASPDEVKAFPFLLQVALVEVLHAKGDDAATEAAARAAIAKYPTCKPVYYFLGALADKREDVLGAVQLYKQCVQTKIEQEFAKYFHFFALDDQHNEAALRHNFLEETRPKYGELKGSKFLDGEKELSVELPPKAKAWHFLFPEHAPLKAGSIEPHVITVGRISNRRHEVKITIQGAGANVDMTLNNTGTKVKISETENFAEAYRKELLADTADESEVTALRKTKAPNGMTAYYFSYKGKFKKAVEQHKTGERKLEPEVWENHVWIVKGKKHSFWIRCESQEDFWKRFQKEIQMVLRSIKFPD